jgi:hypothetical protein
MSIKKKKTNPKPIRTIKTQQATTHTFDNRLFHNTYIINDVGRCQRFSHQPSFFFPQTIHQGHQQFLAAKEREREKERERKASRG